MTIDYECPQCGMFNIEEVLINATAVSGILVMDNGEHMYITRPYVSSGDVSHYQCAICGKEVGKNITSPEELADYLMEEQDER